MDLSQIRQNIDALDAQIIALLKQRAEQVHHVGEIKKQTNSPIFVPEREEALFAKIDAHNAGELNTESLHHIYREIISASLSMEGGIRVAYLGPEGTWSHYAALMQFGKSSTLIPVSSFDDIFDMIERNQADYGILPIENSTFGAVTTAMDLFAASPLGICAQVALTIRHSLMSSTSLENINRIYSHPQVFGQSRKWIAKNLPLAELIETSSTTKAAQLAANNPADSAALGSPLAAELSGLQILVKEVQDCATNTTRFAVLGKQTTQPTGKDRTSLVIRLHHKPGTLAELLQCFSNNNISLLRIESRPSQVANWDYVFYIDAEGHALASPLKEALQSAEEKCSMIKVLGSYIHTEPV